MAGLFALRLPDGDVDEWFEKYEHLLNPYYRDKIARIKHLEAKMRGLTAARLLAGVVTKNLPISLARAAVRENDYGKPYLPAYQDFHFNLSHSGDWAVCAVDSAPLGVDVQEICPKTDLSIAEHCFTPIEIADLKELPCVQQRDYFFTLWALKESYIKAEGKGLSIALDSFAFRLPTRDTIDFYSASLGQWYFKLYDFAPDYKLALCLKHDNFPEIEILGEGRLGMSAVG